MTAETNCLDCSGSITATFDFQPAEPDSGFHGGVDVWGVQPNEDCVCEIPRTWLIPWIWDRDLIEHAEEAAREYLLTYDEAVC